MSNDVYMMQLGMSENEKKLFEQKKIEYNKKMGNILRKSRAEAKNSECYICGKEFSSFCNSHSVPRFCLENISVNGHLYHSGNLVDLPMLDNDKGINEAGTFRIICRGCDSKVFSDYENPDNYFKEPTDKMLSQIAMKNYLKSISKRELEIKLYESIAQESGNYDLMSHMQSISKYDLNEYIDEFKYAKKASQSKWNNNYYLCHFEIIDYVVPLAFQNNICLVADIEGQVINNIYDPSPDYVLKSIHICVFPLANHSVIMMFVKSGERRYGNFIKQFRKLSNEEKLKVINFIIFSYSEDYYLYKGIDQEVLRNENLKNIAKQTTVAFTGNQFADSLHEAKETYDINRRNTIPNLLSELYKVK